MPDIRYAKNGGTSIAYQIVGDGPTALVYVPDFVSNLVYAWESPYWREFYERLARSFRLIGSPTGCAWGRAQRSRTPLRPRRLLPCARDAHGGHGLRPRRGRLRARDRLRLARRGRPRCAGASGR